MALSQDLRRTRPQQQELSQFWQSVGSDPNDIRLPSGFDRDSLGWEPGRVMSQEEVQKVWENLHTGYKDFGLDFNTYLNDPRSAIRQENGQYVYRPENVTDYWAGINDGNFGFADLAKGFLTTPSITAPLMALGGGILGMEGIIGSAAGQMGSSAFPTFLGDAAAGVGGAAAGAAGSLPANYWNMVADSGQIATDVAPGLWETAGQVANTLPPAEFGSSFAPTLTQGTTAAADLGWNLGMPTMSPGMAGTAAGAAALGGAATSFGGPLGNMVVDGAGNISQGLVDLGNSAVDLAPGTGGPGGTPPTNSTIPGQVARTTIGRLLSGQGGIDDYLAAIGLLGGTALGVKGAKDQQDATKELYDNFYKMGQPYRDSLSALNSNPSSFYSSPQYQGALDYGTQAVGKALSAKGGNPWGNETSKQAMLDFSGKFGLDAYNQRWNQLSSAGQLGLGATPGLGLANVQAQGGIPNAVGAGIAGLTTPTYNLGDIVGEDEVVARRRANEARRNSYPTWMNP
jgi:hypothetical protein